MTQPLHDALSFALIPTRTRDLPADAQQTQAFAAWRALWAPAFTEVGAQLNDADYFASDAVLMLTHQGQPIALSLLSNLDLQDSANPWRAHIPTETLKSMLADGHRHVLMGSYFAVHADWRGSKAPFPTKLVLISLLSHCLLHSDATMIVGVMRRQRGMTDLGVRHGAQRLEPGAPLVVHGEPADVLTMVKADVPHLPDPVLDDLVHALWAGRHTYDLPTAPFNAWSASRKAS